MHQTNNKVDQAQQRHHAAQADNQPKYNGKQRAFVQQLTQFVFFHIFSSVKKYFHYSTYTAVVNAKYRQKSIITLQDTPT